MNIISNLFAFDGAQVFQALLFLCEALGRQTIHFALCFCITLSTNAHSKILPNVEALDLLLASYNPVSTDIYVFLASSYLEAEYSPSPFCERLCTLVGRANGAFDSNQ